MCARYQEEALGWELQPPSWVAPQTAFLAEETEVPRGERLVPVLSVGDAELGTSPGLPGPAACSVLPPRGLCLKETVNNPALKLTFKYID